MKKHIVLTMLALTGTIVSLLPQTVLANCEACCTRGRWPFRIKDCCKAYGEITKCFCNDNDRPVCLA